MRMRGRISIGLPLALTALAAIGKASEAPATAMVDVFNAFERGRGSGAVDQ
jgi:hypothetical protein